MKLDPAGVEKAARAMKAAYLEGHTPLDATTAALTAYFDHLKSEGLMREAVCVDQELRNNETGWMAASYWAESEEGVSAFIIKMEE